jgi:Ca-activated chloride channel family protein
LFNELEESDESEYENRIIFLTDAMPNIGETSEEGLLGITERNADKKIYATFIGIGVDFNSELADSITKIRGANYYSVHSSKQFKQRMDDEFDYMVTPLVFDLKLSLDAPGYEIEKVYGSPEADEATGELMKVNTLFPSAKEDGETKGGIVLLKLRKTSGEDEDNAIRLKVTYEDRDGRKSSSQESFTFGGKSPEYFQNTGIRQAVLLSRYADLMKDWIIDERENYGYEEPEKPLADEIRGIICPPPHPELGRWERQSVPLEVSKHYRKMFGKFKDYFEEEMDEIGDGTLEPEVDIMEKLASERDVEFAY